MEYTLEQLVEKTMDEMPRWLTRRPRRQMRWNPDAFYSHVASMCYTEACPFKDQAKAGFGDIEDASKLKNVVFGNVDPENLRMILDFLKWVIENLPLFLDLLS